MHATKFLAEADRLMTLCNSCRYCEGLCAVFPAMEMRRTFTDADLNYLANLCHSCGACYADCQFSPPHEFNINIPQTFALVRGDSYASYAWPAPLSRLFERNGLVLVCATALSVAAFIYGFGSMAGGRLFAREDGVGAFYRIMPHTAMVALFGVAFVYAIVALTMSLRNFWRAKESRERTRAGSVWQAVKDAASLRYLDGGGAGCVNEDGPARDLRRWFHHATFYGFALCFAATGVATLYHYLFGWDAPYAWYDVPVLLGSVGGIGMVVGPLGLLAGKVSRAKDLKVAGQLGMDVGFIVMLLLTGLTGLLLLLLRQSAAMNLLLALHLAVVFALFVSLPYSKFVHGLYRFAALVRYAQERRAQSH